MSMMNAETVISKLKEIGPHVFYASQPREGQWLHTFRVQNVPHGNPKHLALLAYLSDSQDFLLEDGAIDFDEGRKRYLNG